MRRAQHRETGAGHEAAAGEADALAGADGIAVAVLPVDVVGDGGQALVELAAGELQTRGAGVVRGNLVLASQLQRVDAQLVCDLVHVYLVREVHLAGAVAAHCAAGRVVGVRPAGGHVDVFNLVREGGADEREGVGGYAAAAVGAAVQDVLAALCKQLALFGERGLNLEGDWVAGTGTHEHFVALEDALYGVAGHLRELAGAQLVGEAVQFAAETAAEHGLYHAHGALGHAEAPGYPVAADVGALSCRPDRPLAVFVLGDGAVRLDGRVHHLLRAVVALVGVVGFSEGLIRVAGVHDREDGEVVRAGIVYRGRVRLHGVEGVEHRLKRLVFDLDQRSGEGCGLLGGGADSGDLVADHADLLAAERLFVSQLLERLGVAEVVALGEVGAGQHALDAGHLECLGEVYALDERVGIWGMDQLAVVHSG